MSKYILSSESTIDLPYSYVNKRDISIIFYSYTVNQQIFVDDMGRDENALPNFYKMLDEGALPNTSQINKFQYFEYFDDLLQKGDVIHLAFGTGMTPSYLRALEAKDELMEKYPDRKLIIIDTTCSSSGFGLLLDDAADKRDEGYSIDELANWVESVKYTLHHQFYSTDLKYFKRSGRVSGATAMIATILGICPIMHLNYEGKIISYSKARGKKKAISTTLDEMEAHAIGGKEYSGKCFISHSNSLADAETTAALIKERFPNVKEVKIYDIGTIIASHTGGGTVAVYFYGDERTK